MLGLLFSSYLFLLFQFFLRTRAAEGIEHRIIPFVARVFEILIAGFLSQWESDLERRGIRFRIVDRSLRISVIRTDAGEALRQFEASLVGSAAAVAAMPVLLPRKLVVSTTSVLPSQ